MIIGILGVGHLAHSILRRLIASGHPPAGLLLSPRGQAARLSAEYMIPLAADNHALVESSDIVLLAVRPAHAAGAVAGLPWRERHLIVSACAGVPIAVLEKAALRARVMRIMPVTACEVGASPTTAFPDIAEARILLDPLGPVIPLKAEADFEIATVSAAIYGWAQELIRLAANWQAAEGLDPETARRLVALTFSGAGRLIAEKPEGMERLLEELVTPGGITERGLDVLRGRDVPQAWTEACAAVIDKLKATAD
ncbi:pyrroline-5-carboxylate reductase family protein [Ensifer soli]|uniref:pyrroline-5-carboxylate reductase family protein n=1 Tax=Ciceribacter sp. sgz301302 TaxID=3342379 RepID=UPI0035B7CD79